MTLPEKGREVEKVFEQLDREIAEFQSETSLHCKPGCGKCCFKADIEATPLEFLPFALYLHQSGSAEVWRENLMDESSILCKILNPTSAGIGLCSQYAHRGLICRLFGYSARTNKYGVHELVTCSVIKEEQSAAYEKSRQEIAGGMKVPIMNEFYMQLHAIDEPLTSTFYPINVAIRKAIEAVLHYYAYRSEA